MKSIALIGGLMAMVVLSGCDDKENSRRNEKVSTQTEHAGVALVTTAPDGTKLWAVYVSGRYVYFSSSGTSAAHTKACGKNCIETIPDDVPNAQ